VDKNLLMNMTAYSCMTNREDSSGVAEAITVMG
jgi:hypothetical protein